MSKYDLGFFKRIFSTKALAVVAAVCLPLGAASAATFDPGVTYKVTNQSSSTSWDAVFKDSSNSNAWYRTVKISNGSTTEAGGAGLFRMVATANQVSQDFLAFCLSPWQDLRQPNTYQVSQNNLGLDSTQLGRLGSLVRHAWGLVTNRDTAAAFQLAAWEIVSEQGASPYDLTSGAFQLKGVYNGSGYSLDYAGVRAMAQGWLDNLRGLGASNWTGLVGNGFTLLQYTDGCDKTQNLLTVAPVPLPATGLLMLGGFGLLAGVKRRKRTA